MCCSGHPDYQVCRVVTHIIRLCRKIENMKKLITLCLAASVLAPAFAFCPEEYVETERFSARYAVQGVAVDAKHVYAIENTHITKFTKQGDSLTTWSAPKGERFRHINYGIVLGSKLYCAASNFPLYPMTSSVEIFDTKTMTHIGTHSFGIDYGSLTWIIPTKGGWYAFFAHYTRPASKTKTTDDFNCLSQLVKFDKKWQKLEAWTIPSEILDELGTTSLSGGILVGDVFYCTGHDSFEMYQLRIPKSGSALELTGRVKVPFFGQAPAIDRDGSLWGIIRKENAVVHGVRK